MERIRGCYKIIGAVTVVIRAVSDLRPPARPHPPSVDPWETLPWPLLVRPQPQKVATLVASSQGSKSWIRGGRDLPEVPGLTPDPSVRAFLAPAASPLHTAPPQKAARAALSC